MRFQAEIHMNMYLKDCKEACNVLCLNLAFTTTEWGESRALSSEFSSAFSKPNFKYNNVRKQCVKMSWRWSLGNHAHLNGDILVQE